MLIAYRTTPHPATGLSPGEMLFRHGYRGAFPNRRVCSDKAFKSAVKKMIDDKNSRCENLNNSSKRKSSIIKRGQWVYVRNNVRNKFDPLYLEEPWIVESVTKNGVILHNPHLNKWKRRHMDDIKPYHATPPSDDSPNNKRDYTGPLQAHRNTSYFTLPCSDNSHKPNNNNELIDSHNNHTDVVHNNTHELIDSHDNHTDVVHNSHELIDSHDNHTDVVHNNTHGLIDSHNNIERTDLEMNVSHENELIESHSRPIRHRNKTKDTKFKDFVMS